MRMYFPFDVNAVPVSKIHIILSELTQSTRDRNTTKVQAAVKNQGIFGFLDALQSKSGCIAYTELLLLEFLCLRFLQYSKS